MSWDNYFIELDTQLRKTKFYIERYCIGTWAESILSFFREEVISGNWDLDFKDERDWEKEKDNYSFEFIPFEEYEYKHEVAIKLLNLKYKYAMLVPNDFYMLFDYCYSLNDVQYASSWDWQLWWRHTFGKEYPDYDMKELESRPSDNRWSGYYDYLRSDKNTKPVVDFVARKEDIVNKDMIRARVVSRTLAIRAFEWFVEFLEQCFESGATEIRLLRIYEHYEEDFEPKTYEVSVKQLKSNLNWYEEMHRNIIKKSNNNIELFIFKK
ncbi:MAG: hypothetical protein FWF56_06610 [Firmicutes bacterium]|nr:hypothetical protein [Bacillota bacterium]